MPVFGVEFSETQYYSANIEAETKEEAERKVENGDCEKRFIRYGCTNIYHFEVL